MQNELLNTLEAAEKLRLSKGTLEVWRHLGRGPKYLKIGRRVYYSITDLNAYVESSKVDTVDSYHQSEVHNG